MRIFRELLTSETVEPEVKTTYEYVVDLKERLQDTCELTQQELLKSQVKQQKHYNRKTQARSFQTGDRVLILLPTDSNKLLLQWKGPFTGIQRVRGDDYKAQLSGNVETYHANMQKKYWEREDNGQSVATCIKELNAVIVEADDELDAEIDFLKLNRRKLTEMLRLVRICQRPKEKTDGYAERILGCVH